MTSLMASQTTTLSLLTLTFRLASRPSTGQPAKNNLFIRNPWKKEHELFAIDTLPWHHVIYSHWLAWKTVGSISRSTSACSLASVSSLIEPKSSLSSGLFWRKYAFTSLQMQVGLRSGAYLQLRCKCNFLRVVKLMYRICDNTQKKLAKLINITATGTLHRFSGQKAWISGGSSEPPADRVYSPCFGWSCRLMYTIGISVRPWLGSLFMYF